MKSFFKVTDLKQVFEYKKHFPCVESETIPLAETNRRILAQDMLSDADLPGFFRSAMDGYAVKAASIFGASEGNPAYLNVKGVIAMGETPSFSLGPGEAARISTGGMLPQGADSVVMIEHTEALDETTIEVYRSVAPGQHVLEADEDFKKGETILSCGQRLRPQEIGMLAAFGKLTACVYQKPLIGIISTGDEIISIDKRPDPGQIRDINTYTLSALIQEAGGIPLSFGIVPDNYEALYETCARALSQCHMVLLSGGSSVGTRDFTVDVLSALPDAEILVHGISVSPGKPTILAKVQKKAFWGLPGHVVSAMIIFSRVVQPFIAHIAGLRHTTAEIKISAILSRNVASVQGRTDYVRVRLIQNAGTLWAEPVLGKSGLLNTMIKADGMIEIGMNIEGLEKGTQVLVIPM